MAGRKGAAAQTSAATPTAAGRTVHRLKNPYLDNIAVSSDPGRQLGQRADNSIYSQCSKLQRCGYGALERRRRAFSMRPFGPNCRRYAASYSWAPLSLVQRAEMMSQLQE